MSVEEGALVSSSNGHGSLCKPHAVIFACPGQGHLNPLLHLSKRLASEFGFSITFVSIDFTLRRVISTLQSQDELDVKFVSLPDGIPAEATRTGDMHVLCEGLIHCSSSFERLLAELRPPPTCVISDILVLHTQDAANKLGIPRVAFWTASAASFAAHVVAAKGLLPSDCGEGTLLRNIAGAPPLRFKDLPGFLQAYKEPDYMFNFCTQPFTRLQETHCVLMNSFEAMEGEALAALRQQMPDCRFYSIGPILPLEYFSGPALSKSASNLHTKLGFWAEDYSCLEWLDAQQEGSVLYVSFGSVSEFSEQELVELALGLEATCFPIFWVLRPGVLEGTGHASLPPEFKDRTRGRVLIIEWAPQLQVLAHPSVGGFFTHGGWNSILEAASQGKPLLGFPCLADQMLNCRCIEDLWGTGLALERHGEGLLTRSVVESKARALMSDAKFHKAALLLRDAARRAILSTEQGSSTSNLNDFINSLSISPAQLH